MLVFLCIIYLMALTISHAAATTAVDLRRTKVWGPGLHVNSQLPTRYFYIELYDQDGSRYAQLSILQQHAFS